MRCPQHDSKKLSALLSGGGAKPNLIPDDGATHYTYNQWIIHMQTADTKIPVQYSTPIWLQNPSDDQYISYTPDSTGVKQLQMTSSGSTSSNIYITPIIDSNGPAPEAPHVTSCTYCANTTCYNYQRHNPSNKNIMPRISASYQTSVDIFCK